MKSVIFFLILLIGTNAAAAESIMTINISNNGDAFWTMEKFIHFDKESDFSEWTVLNQNMSKYKTIPEYEEIITSFQNHSENFTNRSMEVEKFKITYDTKRSISERLGIIKYSFKWKNFSYVRGGKIYIGDAIPDGTLILSPDNKLIIRIPEGYHATNVIPAADKTDGRMLIWEGALYKNFSTGEPFIELSPNNIANMTGAGIERNSWSAKWQIIGMILILIFIMAIVAFRRLWKKKSPGNVSTSDVVTQVPREMLHEITEIPEAWTKIVQSVQKEFGQDSIDELEKAVREQRLKNMGVDPNIPFSELTREDLEDEEMIRQFLMRSGGQAYQTQIVEHSGLSKSKISMVLSKMKDDGVIIKIRKGKENLIRLARETNE